LTAITEQFKARSTSRNRTFIVRIYRTEHGTWQGQLAHVQSGQVHYFQSCLEMLKMMESVREFAALEDGESHVQSQEAN